jgi:CheY-like chemotaxis protein
VLLDIGLPGMDGYIVAGQLRAAGHDRAALVAVTGYGQDKDLRRSKEAGFDRHLIKPVDSGTLRKLVAEVSERLGSDSRHPAAEAAGSLTPSPNGVSPHEQS